MGVDRSVEVSYGFAMAESGHKLLERLGVFDENADIDADLQPALTANGTRLDLLTVTLGGNSWSGPERWAIVAKDSIKYKSDDDDDSEVIFNVNDAFVSTAARQQLGLIHEILKLDKETVPIGWKLLFNVG